MLIKKSGFIVSFVAFMLLLALASSGCGGGGAGTPAASAPSKPTTTADGRSMSSIISGYSKLSGDEAAAAIEALMCAEDANCGSTFKAVEVKSREDWACVDVQEIEVPLDESVSFSVYLRREGPGRWGVVQTGTGLTMDDIPGAPAEIFN